MRVFVITLALAAAVFSQSPPALDVVLLVEDSIAATGLVRRPDLRSLRPGDRVAVMTFADKQSLKLAFEADPAKIDHAVSNLDARGARSTTRLWDAVVKAAELFGGPRDPSRRRAVILVFSAEDESSKQTAAGIRAALRGSEVSLSAATLSSGQLVSAIPRISQAPIRTPAPQSPDVWSERVPVTQGKLMPGETLRSVEMLVEETGGLVLKNEWDFVKLVEHARSR